jgi:hypothetical protein
MSVFRDDLRRFIAGHALANAVIAEERWERLARLTEEEARRLYDGLSAGLQLPSMREGLDRLDQRRLQFLLSRRARLDAVARGRPR